MVFELKSEYLSEEVDAITASMYCTPLGTYPCSQRFDMAALLPTGQPIGGDVTKSPAVSLQDGSSDWLSVGDDNSLPGSLTGSTTESLCTSDEASLCDLVMDTSSADDDDYGPGSTGSPGSPGLPRMRPRMLMKDWLRQHLDHGNIPGLDWMDSDAGVFRMSWTHGSRHGWQEDRDACLFRKWALHTGKYSRDGDSKKWKATFRCALNSLPDLEEMKRNSQRKGKGAFKVYRFKRKSSKGGYLGIRRVSSVPHNGCPALDPTRVFLPHNQPMPTYAAVFDRQTTLGDKPTTESTTPLPCIELLLKSEPSDISVSRIPSGTPTDMHARLQYPSPPCGGPMQQQQRSTEVNPPSDGLTMHYQRTITSQTQHTFTEICRVSPMTSYSDVARHQTGGQLTIYDASQSCSRDSSYTAVSAETNSSTSSVTEPPTGPASDSGTGRSFTTLTPLLESGTNAQLQRQRDADDTALLAVTAEPRSRYQFNGGSHVEFPAVMVPVSEFSKQCIGTQLQDSLYRDATLSLKDL